jgi:Mg2+-importing ATPase
LSELVIALVVRTRRPFFRSTPSPLLLASTAALIVITFVIPYVPFAGVIGFVPLPAMLMVTVCAITGLYVLAAEGTKRWFFRARLAVAA